MIVRFGHRQQLECDECGRSPRNDYDKEDFDIMISDAKRDDWLIINDDGEWKHICPSCN